MTNWLKNFICSWFHGGGQIKRDELDRVNWQCNKCGRWADPVPHDVENRLVAKDIVVEIRKRGQA